MRADRFGSYSTVETVAGMPFLSRLKSMTREFRLCPPPRHQDVSSPWLLRPPDLRSGSMSGRCDSVVVMSSNVWTVWKRRPGDVGLYLRIGMTDPCLRTILLPSFFFLRPSYFFLL